MAEQIEKNAPRHIAVIMDGNRRWAKKRFLPAKAGVKAGAETLRKLAEKMNAAGYSYLTVFAFSTENWSRPAEEVDGLMGLLRDYIRQYIEDSEKNNMRIRVIGDTSRLDADLRDRIAYLERLTESHSGMCVSIAINYGGRDEIVRAAKKMCAAAAKGETAITEEDFSSYMDTWDMPDPDMIIRTAGEKRLSNFLLWQAAYTEFFFFDKFWPDFTFDDLQAAVDEFMRRGRRFGG